VWKQWWRRVHAILTTKWNQLVSKFHDHASLLFHLKKKNKENKTIKRWSKKLSLQLSLSYINGSVHHLVYCTFAVYYLIMLLLATKRLARFIRIIVMLPINNAHLILCNICVIEHFLLLSRRGRYTFEVTTMINKHVMIMICIWINFIPI
jgi:hypothetical protein